MVQVAEQVVRVEVVSEEHLERASCRPMSDGLVVWARTPAGAAYTRTCSDGLAGRMRRTCLQVHKPCCYPFLAGCLSGWLFLCLIDYWSVV